MKVHDAQIVAEMIIQGITHLLMLDAGDFGRYVEIKVVQSKRGESMNRRSIARTPSLR